jgi:predicted DNA-binding protein (MmcQ/YjbR family)
MKLDDVIEHCRRLKHTAEDVKWGSVLAFSIGGKMYCCLSLDEKFGVSFKCSPGNFLALTDLPGIIPAPYLAKYHWVKITTPRALPKKELLRLIAESQRIVQNGLPRKIKQTITQPGQAGTKKAKAHAKTQRRKVTAKFLLFFA